MYTTDPDAAQWQWSLVRYVPDQYKLVSGLAGGRRPPAGISEDGVGWLCDPQDVGNKWEPRPADLLRLTREAAELLVTLGDRGECDDLVVVPGADGGQLSALSDIARSRLPVRGQAGSPRAGQEKEEGAPDVKTLNEL